LGAHFVDDDSPDGTSERIGEISRRERRVRCLQGIVWRGLASACIKGALATSASYIAVMDADMQHDEKLLPQMGDGSQREPVDWFWAAAMSPAAREADPGNRTKS
jgi:dolichol-phosphate mannosyltransferase